MAISATAPFTCRLWTLETTTPSPSSSSIKLSNFSFLQSHSHFPPLTLTKNRRFAAFPSNPRTLHVVKAKKQTFSSLDELLEKAEKPVLVDFYATWCGPCQFMAPILNEVSITMGDTLQVVKIDTEKYPEIANKYSIEALPTFILFKDGKPFDRFVSLCNILFLCSSSVCIMSVGLAFSFSARFLSIVCSLSWFIFDNRTEGALTANQLMQRIEDKLKATKLNSAVT
ncbi:hypothetical protein OSB04_025511 [Centaurea solstitialis]|uniref:Thioredoxin domain-containing protein n=1 Tax=Centaurea solstitialis TaxID=347529 RepID=A0AA38SN82_9ASTR|nr:hypothetical protein OSB04_025511 [Centaurea solstitialis]